ncbi:type III-B CRISPR module RAMP protein Cmr6 [Pyrococcus yayanosii]|uniref:Crispr-associated ramp protein, Cmr6 family, putative n=1 Tax=Pyrococcus yayanosii (strain CH1 / JCM 16557) TaxID=529709 RepID=F8AJ07_PYRYC|nr:type III-B CRISPR module RAMP protein Cmr6 [Pyrococcus yayanosii]AEH24490.1 crispr-associated ramp protein, Cmr6 family, putative [Pyrococcus yayanosii CH1]
MANFRRSHKLSERNRHNDKKVKFIVPADTLKALEENPWRNISNVSLLLMKYVPYIFEKEKNNTYKAELKAPGISDEIIEAYSHYLAIYLEMLGGINTKAVLRLKSRLVVGLGDESVYETSIRLLRNYGVPYIPGSALKGIAKHYAFELLADVHWELLVEKFQNKFKRLKLERDVYGAIGFLQNAFEKDDNSLKKLKELNLAITLKDGTKTTVEELVDIFGTLNSEGKVVFFDALPSPVRDPPANLEQLRSSLKDIFKEDVLELDIMNPHYQPYYQEGKPPGDWYSPTPIFFLTVKKDTPFVFAVGPSKTCNDRKLVEKAWKLLKEALREHGVGAKTALGYGRFE